MAKKLLVMLLALLLISAVSYASVNKRNIDNTPVIIKQSPNLTKGHIITSLADPLIWEDNFEGTNPMWIPDASWNHVEAPAGGRGYQTSTSWSYLEEGGNHYWNASENLDQELDFLVSPPIKLPIELTSETGAKMPLKGLKLDYQIKGTVNDATDDTWHHLLGPSESVWGFDNTAPGAGTSSWFCDYHQLSSERQWRQWLSTPEINLTGSTGALTFKHAYAVEPEYDYVAVDISTDNFLTYTNLGFWGQIAGGKEDWKDISIDIAAWTGKTVKIRWSSKGDYGTAVTGWWVDEINVGGVFKDDGGETGTTQMTTAGFTAGNIANGYFGGNYVIGTTLNDWLWASAGYASFPLEVAGFGSNFGPDSEVRMAFQWLSDGDAPVGNGLCIDNFKLLGIGKPDKDIALLGANTLSAKLGADFSPTVYFLNNGLLTATGAFVWTGTIYDDAATKVATLFGQAILNVKSDSVFTLKPAKAWIPEIAGVYTLKVAGSYQGDKDLLNDSLEVDFWVPGAPWSEVLWREDFDTNPIATSLEDLGFTVVNGGGDAYGNNLNTWEYINFGIYGWTPLVSVFWGNVDPGANTTDSSEVLDESLITPPIDITSLGKNNTLHVNLYTYYRSGYPGAAYTDFGVATSELRYQVSLDGTNWMEFFYWVDKDGLPGNGPRLPNFRFPDRTLPYTAKLEFDLTPILAYREAGQNQVWLK
ncbi:immune inhibitor A, partial [candidate division KSB1 bacterium]|nr:immune inhibitor A [candidate division KSB1 bacterium]